MGGTRRRFSREFKLEAVRMVSEGGHSANQVARDLDIRPDMLRRWCRQFEEDPEQAFPGVGQRRAREEEVWQLRRQLDLGALATGSLLQYDRPGVWCR